MKSYIIKLIIPTNAEKRNWNTPRLNFETDIVCDHNDKEVAIKYFGSREEAQEYIEIFTKRETRILFEIKEIYKYGKK